MYAEPITVTDIAAQAYLSPSYFSFMFRTLIGYTVKNYLNRYRLYRAVLDLRGSNKQIVEIAYVNGFSSQQGFTRSFSQIYGIAPAQFRLLSPPVEPFPPENLWDSIWKEPSMEFMDCFKSVRFMHKNAFYMVGLEVDIHYNSDDGGSPIVRAWDEWKEQKLADSIPNQISPGTCYGLTHSETADNLAKYMVCVEVSTLENLPTGLVARKFPACDYAVFDVTLDDIFTGFWRTFYTEWLPSSGYTLLDNQYKEEFPTFGRNPDIEVYPKGWENEQSPMHVYAPVVKK